MMTTGYDVDCCPACGSRDVRRSASALRHALRVFLRSRKRACLSCGRKWHAETGPTIPLVRRPIFIIAAGVAVGILGALLTNFAALRPEGSKADVVHRKAAAARKR